MRKSDAGGKGGCAADDCGNGMPPLAGRAENAWAPAEIKVVNAICSVLQVNLLSHSPVMEVTAFH